MNGPVSALLAAARRALEVAVRPELASDHARSQLAGVLDILAKLERMSDWAPAMLQDEQQALQVAVAAVEARAAAAGLALPAPPAGDGLALWQARSRQLSDWLYDHVPAGALRDEIDATLRAGLREAVAAERRHVPRTDFSAMTASKEG